MAQLRLHLPDKFRTDQHLVGEAPAALLCRRCSLILMIESETKMRALPEDFGSTARGEGEVRLSGAMIDHQRLLLPIKGADDRLQRLSGHWKAG